MGSEFGERDAFGGFLEDEPVPEAGLEALFPQGTQGGPPEVNYFSDHEVGGDYFSQVVNLTDKLKEANAVPEHPPAGTRVRFKVNLGSVLTYDDVPEGESIGEVVTVRTAAGDLTEYNGLVFTLWPDGKVRPIAANHLWLEEVPSPPAATKRVANLGDLNGFLRVAADTLINKATRDLWSVRKDGKDFVIERLFRDDGNPLKA